MRRAILPAAAIALLAITGCVGSSEPAAQPKPKAATVTTAAPTYDAYDCRALLERNYDDDTVHDASDEPECESLTRAEYVDAVKKVITGRKDEILDTAADEVAWDAAWEQTDPDQQDTVCDRLIADGPEVVGAEMAGSTGDEDNDQIAMSRYILKEKC